MLGVLEKILCYIIEDTGIGMNEKDVFKAFEKGYTGENGRKYCKSTGMGLYLCKKLSNKLGLGINIESTIGKGTKVAIVFPINKMMIFQQLKGPIEKVKSVYKDKLIWIKNEKELQRKLRA